MEQKSSSTTSFRILNGHLWPRIQTRRISITLQITRMCRHRYAFLGANIGFYLSYYLFMRAVVAYTYVYHYKRSTHLVDWAWHVVAEFYVLRLWKWHLLDVVVVAVAAFVFIIMRCVSSVSACVCVCECVCEWLWSFSACVMSKAISLSRFSSPCALNAATGKRHFQSCWSYCIHFTINGNRHTAGPRCIAKWRFHA